MKLKRKIVPSKCLQFSSRSSEEDSLNISNKFLQFSLALLDSLLLKTLEIPLPVLYQLLSNVQKKLLQMISTQSTQWQKHTPTTLLRLWMKRQRLTASLLKPKLLKKLSKRLVRTFSNLRVSINFIKKFLNSFNNQKTESKRTLNTRKKTQMALPTKISSMRKTSKFSKRRIRLNKNSKFPSLSASESCSKLIKSTAENWSKSCKPQFCQLLPLMDPSISKSSCFSFWMIWLNF